MQHAPSPSVGILLALLSATGFGLMGLFGRLAYADGIDPMSLLLMRFALAAACLWALVLARGLRLPRGRPLAMSLLMGLVFAVNAGTYFVALTMAPLSLVAVTFYVYPACVLLLAWWWGLDRLIPRQVGAMLLAVVGAAMAIPLTGGGAALGVALAVSAAAIYAVYIVIGRSLEPAPHPIVQTALVTTVAACAFGVAVAVNGFTPPKSLAGLGGVAMISLVCTVLAMTLFLAALRHLSASAAATLSAAEPIVAAAAGALFLQEPLSLRFVAGAALIVAATVLVARSAPASRTPASTAALA
jgi:drug/metabolite transporter (DMT)-like permease